MKPVYNNIQPVTGHLETGICVAKIIPREWLALPLAVEFTSNTILTEPVLLDGKTWLSLEFVQPTYDYSEKPKTSNGGTYYEILLTGSINNIDASLLQTLETLRYHEHIAIVKDRKGRERIIGDPDSGMTLQVTNRTTNDNGGNITITIELSYLSDAAPPFYIEP